MSFHLNQKPFIIGLLLVLVYELPYLILGEQSHLYIEDNLDAVVSCLLVMLRAGKMFDFHSVIDQIMNGLPREFLANGINISTFSYLFFSPFSAYLINDILVHLIAFAGMFWLLNAHILENTKNSEWIAFGVALCWSFIPHFSIYGISIAGQPLLLFAFLNLKYNDRIPLSLLIIVFFVFYSMLVFVGAFIIGVAILYFLYLWLIQKELNRPVLAGILTLIISYIIAEFPLLDLILFNKNLVSHRVAWDAEYLSSDFPGTIHKVFISFLAGHWHAKSMHTFILLIVLIALSLTLANEGWKKERIQILGMLLIIVLLNLIYAFSDWTGVVFIKETIPFLKSFQVNRIIWLSPILWYLVFALSVKIIIQTKYGKWKAISAIGIQVCILLLYHSEIQYHTKLVYKNTGPKYSYKEFYSEHLFREIKNYIGKSTDSYRVVSLGLHPALTQYSGFYTLDSYQNNYPLSYKNQFRKIISKELEKSVAWKDYFDAWGNRCYLFSAEIPKSSEAFLVDKNQNLKIHEFEINHTILKEMGGLYLFSAAEILNAETTGLSLEKVFEDKESPWKIYLYRIQS